MSNPVVRLLGTLIVCAAFSLPMIITAQSAVFTGFGVGQILAMLGLGAFMVGGLAFIWTSAESQPSVETRASKRKNEERIVRLLDALSEDELDALRARLVDGENYALDDDGELVRKKLRR